MQSARVLSSLLLAIVFVCASGASWPREFPSRPVTIVAGNEPGGPTDLLARAVAQALSEIWNQPVVVENRSGAGGTIAAQIVARAPADGYTLLLGGFLNLAAAPAFDPRLPYDPMRDFLPIGRVALVHFALAASARLNLTSTKELLAYIRANPGRLVFGTVGPASVGNLVAQALRAEAGSEILVVPYKGSATMVTDLLAGRIDVTVTDLSVLGPHAAQGSARLLAVVGSERASLFPNLSTLAEQGLAHMSVDPWYGLLAPAGTPEEVLIKLRAGLQRVTGMPEFRNRLIRRGYVPIQDSSAEFGAALSSDIDRWKNAARAPER
jgi:tripartite-type tricarboxylate transporter receptor subunit TctC